MHLPDDSPTVKRFLQQKLKNWRQRISLAVNCIHALILQQRAAASLQGRRQPPPQHLLSATIEDGRQLGSFAEEDLLEAEDYDLE